MRDLSYTLKNRAIDIEKLVEYGFKKRERKEDFSQMKNNVQNNLQEDIQHSLKNVKEYVLDTYIYDNQFQIIVTFCCNEYENSNTNLGASNFTSKLIDVASEEEYVLVDIQDSTGEFVGKVRQQYENKLQDIIDRCTVPNVYKSNQTKEIIRYVKEKYSGELEFLWEKDEKSAVWRNQISNKWYGVVLEVEERKLGLDSNKIVEIVDLRYQKGQWSEIVDNKAIFRGYHMNKESWITIKLDETCDIKTIYKLIDNSYELSKGNKCGLAGNDLSQKVYNYLTTIPKGKVVTYKQVAEYIGNNGLARVVGNILHKNTDGDKYPCYKVLNSKGELAEAFVFGGKSVQEELLKKDGISVIDGKVDLKKYQWEE